MPLLQAAREAMAAEVSAVQADPARLESQIGAALWVLPAVAHNASRPSRANAVLAVRTVDLNTAEREQLMTLPGVSAAIAERAMVSRDKDGYFTSVADFARRAGLPSAPIQAMHDAAIKAGPYPRE